MNAVLREDLEMITGEDIKWDKLKGKSVLITGAGGMIGSYMLQTLALLNDQHDYGIRILAMLRNPGKLPDEVRSRKDVEVLVHDVTEKLHIEEAVDYVIHAASPASPLIMQNQPGDGCGEYAWYILHTDAGKGEECGRISVYFIQGDLWAARGRTGVFYRGYLWLCGSSECKILLSGREKGCRDYVYLLP